MSKGTYSVRKRKRIFLSPFFFLTLNFCLSSHETNEDYGVFEVAKTDEFSVTEIDSLRQGEFVAPIYRCRLSTHILFP
jgi:hypothetical protein